MGLLMVDSCLLLCSNFTYGPVNYYQNHSHSVQELKDITCSDDPWYVEEGNKMIDWI